MLSGLLFSNDEDLAIDKLMMNAYRAMIMNDSGDDLLQNFNNLEYFYCEGLGTTEISIDGILQDEFTSNTRTEFIFAFQDVDLEQEQSGLFAISDPTMLGDGWLVVSAKFLEDKKWKNVWDSKFSYETSKNPLEDVTKGTVNDFILRVDNYSEIIPNIYIGNIYSALYNYDNFDVIVNCSKNLPFSQKNNWTIKLPGIFISCCNQITFFTGQLI